MSVGARIRRARESRGMTQAELAHALNTDGSEGAKIDVVSISRWERDRMVPHLGTASRLAKALGVSIDWIVNGADGDADDAPKVAVG